MTISNKVSSFVIKNKPVQNFLKKTADNPSLAESMIVAGTTIGLRTATMAVTPSDKDNKKYYMTRSVLTGTLDLVSAMAIYIPIKKGLDKICEKLIKNKKSVYYNNIKNIQGLKTLVNRGSKIIIMVPQAMFMFWAIPKIADNILPKLFNKIKEK